MLALIITIALICGFQNSMLYLEHIKPIDYQGLRGFKPLSYLVLYLIFFVNYLVNDLTPIRYIVYFVLTYGQLTKSYLFATIRDSRHAAQCFNFLQMCEMKENKLDFQLRFSRIVVKRVLKRSGWYQRYQALNPEVTIGLNNIEYNTLDKDARIQYDRDREYFINSIAKK